MAASTVEPEAIYVPLYEDEKGDLRDCELKDKYAERRDNKLLILDRKSRHKRRYVYYELDHATLSQIMEMKRLDLERERVQLANRVLSGG